MMVHQPESQKAIEEMNISKLWNRVRREILKLEGPEGEGDEWGHGEANFGHGISEYDAGYYGYLLYVTPELGSIERN